MRDARLAQRHGGFERDCEGFERDRLAIRQARTTAIARTTAVSLALALALIVSFCISIAVGQYPIAIDQVVPVIFGAGPDDAVYIVQQLRLPRAITAALVGCAFGISGAIFQAIARNTLASPDIIGITAGASTSAVFIIVVLHGAGAVVSLGALGGALATAAVVYVVAFRRGLSSYRLVLVGIGVAAFLAAITSYLLTRAEIYDAQRAAVWLTGSLNGRTWEHVVPLSCAMLLLLPATIALARPLRTLPLGDDTARGLGVPVELSRAGLVLVGVALAAVATAAAGPVVFVAFVSAPVARRLINTPLTVMPAGLVGATLVLAADIAARWLIAPTEFPVGVVTGIIGAPYLIWLLARANRIGQGG